MLSLIFSLVMCSSVSASSHALEFSSSQSRTASVRIVNAIPDVRDAYFQLGDLGMFSSPYGNRTNYMTVNAGNVDAYLCASNGERLTNAVPVWVQANFPHTVIFTGFPMSTGSFHPIVLRDTTAGKPAMSTSQVIFINALSDKIPVKFKLEEDAQKREYTLNFGSATGLIGYGPKKEYTLVLLDSAGKSLFSTKFTPQPGTRYSAIAMGSQGFSGNRAPRVFIYTF